MRGYDIESEERVMKVWAHSWKTYMLAVSATMTMTMASIMLLAYAVLFMT